MLTNDDNVIKWTANFYTGISPELWPYKFFRNKKYMFYDNNVETELFQRPANYF